MGKNKRLTKNLQFKQPIKCKLNESDKRIQNPVC